MSELLSLDPVVARPEMLRRRDGVAAEHMSHVLALSVGADRTGADGTGREP